MIGTQVSRTRELAKFCFDFGLGVLLAALIESGMKPKDFRKVVLGGS